MCRDSHWKPGTSGKSLAMTREAVLLWIVGALSPHMGVEP